MQLVFMNGFFPGKIGQALCWTLVHSLWMGLLLTVVTGIIILCTKERTASLRYNLLTAALFLFTIGLAAIFITELTAAGNAATQLTDATTAVAIATTGNAPLLTGFNNGTGFAASVANFLNAYSNMIVMVWLLIIAFRSVRLAGGFYQIKRMRTTQLTLVNDHWKKRLAELSAALHISQNVQFFQSGIATIPMVLGHFKPVILFPVGLITALPAAEVEAILLHELAHIRRKDYLVNMLQQVLETLLFFNPAVLWSSALIKIERENCCDDIAVAQSSSKRNYINALVSFQEYQLNVPPYATAFANKKYLLQRVKRMLYNNNKTLNNMEKTFLTVCVVAATSLSLFFTQPTTAQINGTLTTYSRDTVISIANKHYNAADFEEGGSYSFSEKINGISHTLYIFKRKGVLYEIYDDIARFKIDGKTIPSRNWGKYKTLISQLKEDYKNDHLAANDEKNLVEKLKAGQLQLITEKSDLNSLLFSLNSNDSVKFSKEQLSAERNKLKAELQLLQKGDRTKAGQMELLAKQDKLMAELESLKSLKLAETRQMKLNAEHEELNTLLLKLNNSDTLQLNQLQLLNEEEKLKTELQLLQKSDKIKAEQQQLLLNLNSKIKAEQESKAGVLQKMAAEKDAEKLILKLAEKKSLTEAEKQGILIEKLKLAEKKLQEEKDTLKLKKQ